MNAPRRPDRSAKPGKPGKERTGLGAFVTEAECAVIAAEATRAGTCPPPVPAWALGDAETYAGKLNRGEWPQEARDLKELRQKCAARAGEMLV